MAVRIALALAAGVVVSLGFEPVALPWLIPPALAGFWLCCRDLSLRRGFVIGLAFGAGFMYVHIFWLRVVGVDAWLLLATALTLFHGPVGALASQLMRRRWWPWALPVVWVAMEWARGTWPFSGMPWGRLSYAVIDTPLASALPYIGATLVSLTMALLASLLAWTVIHRDRWWQGAGLLAVLALLIAIPVVRPWEAPETGRLTAAVVQGDVPGDGDDILLDHRQVTRNHIDATIELAEQVEAGERPRPEFVVWPENSTAVDPILDLRTHAGITEAARAIDVPILVGSMTDVAPGKILNQGIVWDPVTGPGERYTKHHPVPFGEYLPFREILEGWNIGRLHVIASDMLPGTRLEPLQIAGHPVADAICFDIAYDDVLYGQMSRGAEVLTVQTSNATFIHTRQLDQQYAITRVRALELGRSVLVASTNGLTGIIGPDGESIALAERRTTTVLDAEVPLFQAVTPAVRLGEWPARLSALAVLGYLLIQSGFTFGRYLRRGRTTRAGSEQTARPTESSEVSAL